MASCRVRGLGVSISGLGPQRDYSARRGSSLSVGLPRVFCGLVLKVKLNI